MMALRREQTAEQVETIAGSPVIAEKRQLCLGQSQGRSSPSRCNTRRSDTKGHAGLDVFHMRSRAGCSISCVDCLRSIHWCGDGNAVNEGFFGRNCWCCGADAGNVGSHRCCPTFGRRAFYEITGAGNCECQGTSDSAEARAASQSSESGTVEACIQVYRGMFVANKLALEAGIGCCRLLLKHPAIT